MVTTAEPSSSSSPRQRRENRHHPSSGSHAVRGEPEAAAAASPPSQAGITHPEPSDRSPPPPAAALAADDQPAAGPPDAAGAPAILSPSDGGAGGGVEAAAAAASRGKKPKPAWSRPSNGVVEAGPVMGALSWPALSEASRASPRTASSDSGKGFADGSDSAPPASVSVVTSSPPRQITRNANFSPSANHGSPTRQKSMKRGGGSSAGSTVANNGGSTVANGGPVPPSSLQALAEVPEGSLDKPVASQPLPRDLNNRGSSNWDHGSRGGGGGNEQHRNYGGNRRGNSGGGGGPPYHNNFVNRRGLERGGYDWSNRSGSGGRDFQVQQQQQQQQQPRAMARPFLRPPPPGSASFMSSPLPVRPFMSPMGYYDLPSPIFYVPTQPSPDSHGGMPFVGPPAMFYAAPDSQLRATLARQIDYYFSPENLCKDIYLRQNMDEEGWVSISLIANFNRVRNLTNNIQFILETVRTSTVVEVQGDKIRRRRDWMNWPPLTPASNPSTVPINETLAAHVRNVKLEEGSSSQNRTRAAPSTEAALNRSV